MFKNKVFFLTFFSLVLALTVNTKSFAQSSKIVKPNILFIAIDDLNDMIPILDEDSVVKTPNLSKLAARSTLFKNAFTSSTLCNPSRFSLLTGLRPSTTGVYLNTSNSLLLEDKYVNIMTSHYCLCLRLYSLNRCFTMRLNCVIRVFLICDLHNPHFIFVPDQFGTLLLSLEKSYSRQILT